jgi:chromosome segregation ATPase
VTVPPIATNPQPGETLEAFYVRTLDELDNAVVCCLESETFSPLPGLYTRLQYTREALEDLRAKQVRAVAIVNETRIQRLQRHLVELESTIAQEQSRSKTNAAALAALHRRRDDLEARLDEAHRAEQQVPTTPEQLGAAVSEITEQWPDDLLERAARVLAERHKGVIEMVRGERRAKLGPDGWEAA